MAFSPTSLIGPALALAGGLFSGSKDRAASKSADAKNYAMQKEFAQHGIRWKMEDAKRAGVHGMYALGSPGASATASFQGAPKDQTGNIARDLADAGSDIIQQQKTDSVTQTQKALMEAQTRNLNASASVSEQEAMGLGMTNQSTASPQQRYPIPVDVQEIETKDLTSQTGQAIPVGVGSPAQDWEDKYGELAGLIHGTFNWVTDSAGNKLKDMGKLELFNSWREYKYEFEQANPGVYASPSNVLRWHFGFKTK